MEAGPELDMLVEERVMGCCYNCHRLSQRVIENDPEAVRIVKEECRYGSVVYVGDKDDLDADGNRFWYCGRHDKKMIQEAKPRSTEMGAAWEVVEKLALTFELGWLPTDKGLNWDASFGEKRGSEEGTTTYAVTAAHAICLAALKAVE